MPALTSQPYPDPVAVAVALLGDLAPTRLAPPPDFEGGRLITVRAAPGQVDADDVTFVGRVTVSCYGSTYPEAAELAGDVQVRILSAGCTEVAGVLIDATDIWLGGQEMPDAYPDERRISTAYEIAFRRQFTG